MWDREPSRVMLAMPATLWKLGVCSRDRQTVVQLWRSLGSSSRTSLSMKPIPEVIHSVKDMSVCSEDGNVSEIFEY